MFIDGRSIPAKTSLETDLAIIGAGAAGITLARALRDAGFRITLIESGGLDFDADTQALYDGESDGIEYNLDTARLRYFGGSTNHWGGWCRPLEAIDFERRAWVPHSGWPISRADVDPYYPQAQTICQLGPFDYDDPESWSDNGALHPMALPGGAVETRFFQYSPPTRFGQVYRDDIGGAANVRTLLHTNLIEIEASSNASEITGLKLATLEGNRFHLTAKAYVLATGGIENARLLLLSNRTARAGLGNQNDLVGRFFMEHPIVPLVGQIVAAPPEAVARYYHTYTEINGTTIRGCLMFSADYLRRVEGLATILTFSPQSQIDPPAQDGKTATPPSPTNGAAPLERELLTLLNPAAPETGTRYVMGCATEQTPNPESRVTLSGEKDALGLPRTKLAWRLTAQDRHGLRRNLDTLASAIGGWGKGRVRVNFADADRWDEVDQWAHHHMGTTRMSEDPKQGVTDAQGKVHGTANLYIAGSSLFPTAGGASNPTLTIVALALRLADHLKTVFERNG